MGEDLFTCDVCNCMKPIGPHAMCDLDCSCCVCGTCAQEHILAKLKPQLMSCTTGPDPLFAVGQSVRYRDRSKNLVPAVVLQVDRSIQPPQYGIRLADASADDIRFTEQSRLLPSHDSLSAGFPVIPCVHCGEVVQHSVLARLFPDAVRQLEETLTNAWLTAKGVIRCPGCEALIEKLPASGNQIPCSCQHQPSSSSSSSNVRCRCAHKQQHRFRCAYCTKTFCDACLAQPYHDGLNCEEAAAPHCLLCDALVLEALDMQTSSLSTKQLRSEAAALGMDCSWCLERGDLLEVYKRGKQVCEGCRPQLRKMCSRQLPCRHWCCGPRGSDCLPCLQQGCTQQAASVGDGSCCFCLEPLTSVSAVIKLACATGHFVHLTCAQQRLKAGWPGPALTFEFVFCALCGSGSEGRCGNIQVMTAQPHLQHASLTTALQEALQLREQVVRLAKDRLRRSNAAKEDADVLGPGGKFDGRPVDYALSKYQFYACSKCRQPYYGGLKECAVAQQPAAFDASELVCGSCSAVACGRNCPEHGTEYVEFKCRFCCQVASWFCWGTTHMCSRCHDHPEQRHNTCPGPGRCVLTVPHPAPGTKDFCLGCGICRTKDR